MFAIHPPAWVSGEWRCEREECSSVFAGGAEPRRRTAPRHSLPEMLRLALLATWGGGAGGAARERCGRAKEGCLRRCMSLEPGLPRPDACSALFTALAPARLPRVRRRLLAAWAAVLDGEVSALAGKSLRRSCAAAAARSPGPLGQAFAAEARLVLGPVKGEDKATARGDAEAAGAAGAQGPSGQPG